MIWIDSEHEQDILLLSIVSNIVKLDMKLLSELETKRYK